MDYPQPCSTFGFKDGDSSALCLRLNERDIPYVLHSGYRHLGDACHRGIVVREAGEPRLKSSMCSAA